MPRYARVKSEKQIYHIMLVLFFVAKHQITRYIFDTSQMIMQYL